MKKIFLIILSVIFVILPFSACKNDKYTTINLNEVTHSVFYAPLYVAIENGYFLDENIKINLVNGGGADKSMTAVLSKSADIGLMGPETVIYVYKNKKDSPKAFANLTNRDGSFLVSRIDEPNFSWQNLKGKTILAGRRGGVPAMTFEYILKNEGLTIEKDYTLNFDIQFNLMTSAFLEGTGDYCTVFEPTASEYAKQNKWHIVASVGEKGGDIPYTSFIALSSYIENNRTTLLSFIKALKKAYQFMQENSTVDIAKSIIKQFPSTSLDSIKTSIESYSKINAWKTDLIMTETAFDNLQNIMINAKELTEKAKYSDICDNSLLK